MFDLYMDPVGLRKLTDFDIGKPAFRVVRRWVNSSPPEICLYSEDIDLSASVLLIRPYQ